MKPETGIPHLGVWTCLLLLLSRLSLAGIVDVAATYGQDDAAIAAAIAAIDPSEQHVFVWAHNSTFTMSSNTVFPAHVQHEFAVGAQLTIEGSATVTINGDMTGRPHIANEGTLVLNNIYLDAGPRDVFSGSGSVQGTVINTDIYPQWFGANGNDELDDSGAFQNTMDFAGAKHVLIPNGSYIVGGLNLAGYSNIEGESKIGVKLLANGDNANIFQTARAYSIRLRKVWASANGFAGVTFFNHTNKTDYVAYPKFSDLEIGADIEVGFEGAFIFAVWRDCRIGYTGTPGARHIAIISEPGAVGIGHSNNLNSLINTYCFNGRGSGSDGMITIKDANNWRLQSCNFESSELRALSLRRARVIALENVWFEAIDDDYMIYAVTEINGSRLSMSSCYVSLTHTKTACMVLDSASGASIDNTLFVLGPPGLVLVAGGGGISSYTDNSLDCTPAGFVNIDGQSSSAATLGTILTVAESYTGSRGR